MQNKDIDMIVDARMAQLDRNFELDGVFDGQRRRCRRYGGTYMSYVGGDPLSMARCTEDEMKAALRVAIEKEYGYAG